MQKKETLFYANFSVRQLVQRSGSQALLKGDGLGGGGGGSSFHARRVGSSETHFNAHKTDSYACRLNSEESLDETQLFSSLEGEVRRELADNGAQIIERGSSGPANFYFAYTLSDVRGRIELSGHRGAGGYYNIHADLNESDNSGRLSITGNVTNRAAVNSVVRPLMKVHFIVSGIPASGKSTVGRAIATALGLAMLDKDDFLEALFHSQGIGDAEWRKHLSRVADEALREKAVTTEAAVITSWWRHPSSSFDSGTPVEWLSSLAGIVIEVHCVCRPEVAAERFLSRQRHEGHLDHLKTNADLLADFQRHAALGPLGLGRIVSVNTEQTVEMNALLAQIRSALKLSAE